MRGLQYVEPVVCQDVMAHGFANIEMLTGNLMRFTFFVEKQDLHTKEIEKEIVARIVIPSVKVPAMSASALAAAMPVKFNAWKVKTRKIRAVQ